MSRRGETTIEIRGEHMDIVQVYRCPSKGYWLDEDLCDRRQERGYGGCRTCSVRKGGIDDPRPAKKPGRGRTKKQKTV